MKDYRVTVKVRNNRILRAIADAGGEPGGKWCAENGLQYGPVNDLINMTKGPLSKTGEICQVAQKLCDVLNKIPEDLWSNSQLYPLERNQSDVEMDRLEIDRLLPQAEEQSYLPDFSGLENEEISLVVDKVLSSLTERQECVIRMRYCQEMTISEVAKAQGCSRERIRQIEAIALRKLRHPLRSGVLIDCVDDVKVSPEQVAILKSERSKYLSQRCVGGADRWAE